VCSYLFELGILSGGAPFGLARKLLLKNETAILRMNEILLRGAGGHANPEDEQLVTSTMALVEVAQALVRSWTLRNPTVPGDPALSSAVQQEEQLYSQYLATVVHPPGAKRASTSTVSSRPTPQSIRLLNPSSGSPPSQPTMQVGLTMPQPNTTPQTPPKEVMNTSVESIGGVTAAASSAHNTSLSSVGSDTAGGEVMVTLQKELLACTVYLTKLPASLSEQQMRRLLFSFGEVHKVRMYSEKSAAGSGLDKHHRGVFAFAEFAQQSSAKSLIEYFRNCSCTALPFPFLRTPTLNLAEMFSEGDVKALVGTRASYARSAIHDQDPRDAVFDSMPNFSSASSVSDGPQAPEVRLKSRQCTFGISLAVPAASIVVPPVVGCLLPLMPPRPTSRPFVCFTDEEQTLMLTYRAEQMRIQATPGLQQRYTGYSTYSSMLPESFGARRRFVPGMERPAMKTTDKEKSKEK
jgi:hypothetical protein